MEYCPFYGEKWEGCGAVSKENFLAHIGTVQDNSPCKTIYGGSKLFTSDQIAGLTAKGWTVT